MIVTQLLKIGGFLTIITDYHGTGESFVNIEGNRKPDGILLVVYYNRSIFRSAGSLAISLGGDRLCCGAKYRLTKYDL